MEPSFRFYRPQERLRPYLTSYFFADFPGGSPIDDFIYPEWGHIRLVVSGDCTMQLRDQTINGRETRAVIYGPTSHAIKLTAIPPAQTVSVGISPLGWAHLIRLAAAPFTDRLTPLADVLPGPGRQLLDRLHAAPDDNDKRACLDDFFLALEGNRPAPPDLLVRAHELLLDPAIATVEDFAEALGRSTRQVARLATEMFGFPPKLPLRRQRFLRSLALLHTDLGRPWSSFIDDTYYDHSHFVRDFRRFMGMSPSRYYALPSNLAARAAQARRQQIGQSHQGLETGGVADSKKKN